MKKYLILLVSFLLSACANKKVYYTYIYLNNTNRDIIINTYRFDKTSGKDLYKTFKLSKDGGTYKFIKLNNYYSDVSSEVTPTSPEVLGIGPAEIVISDTIVVREYKSDELKTKNNIFDVENYNRKKIDKREYEYTYTIEQTDIE